MEPQTLNIADMTTEQLEALCYRLVEQKSNIEMNLSTVQQQLAQKRNVPANQTELVKEDENDQDGTDEIIHED